MLTHGKAIKRLGRYLYYTNREGIVYNPDIKKVLECYADTDFTGCWQQADSHEPDNFLSRTGMAIMYANCPICWRSTLQTDISLSTAEVEYIALSTALRQVILLMTIMGGIHAVFPIHISKP